MIIKHEVTTHDSFAAGFTVTITLQSNAELSALIAVLLLDDRDNTLRMRMYDRLRLIRQANHVHSAEGFKDRGDDR